MTFPPHDGSDDETTVLPPIDDAPELVRPYVQAVEPDSVARKEPAPEPTPEPELETAPEPEPEPAPEPVAAEPGGATAVLPAPDARPREARGGGRKGWALAGGALLLIIAGTGAALLTQPSGSSPAASTSPSQSVASPSVIASVSASASVVSASPTPSHSASPSQSPKPSPTVRPTPKPSPSTTRPSPSPSPSRTPGAGATLQLGSTGPAVVTLQQDLRALWIDRGLNASGDYDQRTEQDVASFQVWYGVQGDPSGVYGPNSQAKMAQLMAPKGNKSRGGTNGG